jgi:hypothetical protein
MAKQKKKILILVLLSLMLLITLIILILLRHQITLIFLYPYLRDKFTNLGINVWIAKLIALPLAVWVIFIVYLLFSSKNKRRKSGYILGGVTWCIWCISMFFITGDYYFDPQTSEAVKCFANTPYGYRERSCNEKYDPTFGTKVIKVNKNIALSQWVKEHGPILVEKVNPNKQMAFFTPYGEPLYWYYEKPNGQIDIFDHPGRHPQYNTQLNPVTAEVVVRIFKQIDEQEESQKVIFHKSDGTVETGDNQGSNLKHLKKLSDSLKSLHKK